MQKSTANATVALAAAFLLTAASASAAEPVDLVADGLAGWMNRNGEAPGKGWVVEEGVLRLAEKKAGDLWTKEIYGDFVLELEFKTEGNSGIFLRTGDPKNNVQTGLEIQVNKPREKPGKNDVGALYDALAPTIGNATDDWNQVRITAKGPNLTVEMNGEKILHANLDDWDTPKKNPDGSKNKYGKALKEFPRKGHLGFQDHGARVMYRNIRMTVEE